MRSSIRPLAAIVAAAALASVPTVTEAASAPAVLQEAKGDVRVRLPKAKAYAPVETGASVPDGARLKTAKGARAALRYPDGSVAKIRGGSEVIVRTAGKGRERPNGVVLFLGRVWSKVVRSSGGRERFQVRSANAVAGVRGTEFEVGVALDGAALVKVDGGKVRVSGEGGGDAGSTLGRGQAVESSEDGDVGKVFEPGESVDWEGWFTKRAKKMEKRGLAVAKRLDGRLNKRKAKVERLVKKQRSLRQRIEELEKKKKSKGAPVDDELAETLAKLQRVTERLEDMRSRLEGAFGLFEQWGETARAGGMEDAGEVAKMASSIAKIAADFADMIEEGTDLSEEGMHELMDDMGKGKRTGPGDSAADELFR